MASRSDHPAPSVSVPPDDWATLPRFAFGDGAHPADPALADELLVLVLAGTKTATCWDARDGLKGSAVGGCWVVLDGARSPRAVVRTTALHQCRFDAVAADFAFAEGEGDRSLDDWRRQHRAYFESQGHFAPDMMLWCERFDLVAVL
jgi:uncharacterized protein YhfF